MKRAAVLVAGVLSGSLGLGWLTAPVPHPPEAGSTHTLPVLVHGGVKAEAARVRLEALGFDAGLEQAEAFEPPPAPDIAALFRRDLTAIEQSPDGPKVWIVDFTQSFGRRALRRGDVYRDGWRIAAIASQSIELRRRRETRRIAVFEAPPEENP